MWDALRSSESHERRAADASRRDWWPPRRAEFLVVLPVLLIWSALAMVLRSLAPDANGAVCIYTPAVIRAAWTSGWVVALGLVVWSRLPARFAGPRRAPVSVAIAAAGLGSILWALTSIWTGTFLTPIATAPDGSRWLAQWIWDGSPGLCRVESVSAIRVTGRHAANENVNSLPLVLPVEDPATVVSRRVRFAPTGFVVVEIDGRCVVCFDPAAPATPGSEIPPVPPVSPFILLRTAEQGTEASVAAVEMSIREQRDRSESYEPEPSERVLLDALGSANPWIVETARRFIRAGGPTLYPEATKRI